MKLDVDVNEVTLSNTGAAGEFKIRNSAKAFKILSDGLYSNKIKAVIRELSCNALDSHVGAGKADVPFEVHLPTMLEPWFAVRDFGMGLDNDQVINIYTTYFESTKTDSNDFIGALGLGSKSPFSYTENFTVTAIKNGYKRIYSAFINAQGVPSITEMSEELTDEGNGVEVKFSVTERYDYHSFRNEAASVFAWFKNKPNVIGADFQHTSHTYTEKNVVPGVHVSPNLRNCIAVMGNIAYPLDNMPEPEKHLGALAHFLRCGLVLEFDIGELDFAASREQLSYIPMTIESIKKKLNALNANLATHLAAKVNLAKNDWEKAFILQKEQHSQLYKSAVVKYVNDNKFPLFDTHSHGGHKTFSFKIADLAKRKLSIVEFTHRNGNCTTVSERSEYMNGNYVKSRQISVDDSVVIVLNDTKIGCATRARYHFSKHNGNKPVHVFCISHTDDDVTKHQAEYDKFLKELHNPPLVFKASVLEQRQRAKPVPTTGIMEIGFKSSGRGYGDSAYMWHQITDAIDPKKKYYYVSMKAYESFTQDGKPVNTFHIKSLMEECGLPEFKNLEIHGVRVSRIKEIKALNNWIPLEDYLKEHTMKVSDSHIESLIASDALDMYSNRIYTNKTVAKLVGPDSNYSKYVEKVTSIKRQSGNVSLLVKLCAMFGNTLQVTRVTDAITKIKSDLHVKYPMLKCVRNGSNDVSEQEIAQYIKLIDKQEK